MAKKTVRRSVKKSSKKSESFNMSPQEGDRFHTDAIVLLGAFLYNMRQTIKDVAVEKHTESGPISRETVKNAIISLKLSKFLDD
jgi:hypothetical protein